MRPLPPDAQWDNRNLRDMTLPASLEQVGDYALFNCTELKTLRLGDSVNRWGGGAVGLVKGALVLFILCWLLRDSCIPREAVEHSILLKLFCTAAPLSFFL